MAAAKGHEVPCVRPLVRARSSKNSSRTRCATIVSLRCDFQVSRSMAEVPEILNSECKFLVNFLVESD